MTPGTRIKDERIARGWSQQRLSEEISRIKRETISRAAVAQWENGSTKTQKPDNFFAAAQALGLRPRWVLDGTGEKYQTGSGQAYSPNPINPAPTAEQPVVNFRLVTAKEKLLHELATIAEQLEEGNLNRLIERARTLMETQGKSSAANNAK